MRVVKVVALRAASHEVRTSMQRSPQCRTMSQRTKGVYYDLVPVYSLEWRRKKKSRIIISQVLLREARFGVGTALQP